MKLLHTAFAVAIASAFVLGSAGVSEAAKKKKAMKTAAAAPTMCNFEWKPVCGMAGKTKRTFTNSCFAMKDGAKKVKPGACK